MIEVFNLGLGHQSDATAEVVVAISMLMHLDPPSDLLASVNRLIAVIASAVEPNKVSTQCGVTNLSQQCANS